MKLYRVDYYEWNYTFSDLLPRQMLSVGKDAEEAIANVKPRADSENELYYREGLKDGFTVCRFVNGG